MGKCRIIQINSLKFVTTPTSKCHNRTEPLSFLQTQSSPSRIPVNSQIHFQNGDFTGNPQYFADLCAENEVIVPKVPDPEDEAELLVSERDHGVVAEDDRLLSQLGSRELREDKTNHEGLDETTDN